MTIQMKSSVDRLHTAPLSFVKSSTHEILWDLFWVLWPFAKPISSSEQRRNTSTSCLYFEIKPAGSDEIRKLLNIVQTVSDRRSPTSFSFVGWLQEWDARRTVRRALWVLLADICSSLVHRSKLCWSLHIKHYLSTLFVLWFFVPFPHH